MVTVANSICLECMLVISSQLEIRYWLLWDYEIRSCIVIPYQRSFEFGLILCCIRYPHSRMKSIRNMVWLHLFIDCSHVFIFLPFIPVIFTDYFGSFRCLWTDIYRGQNGCLPYTGHSIYIQEEFIAICLARVILDNPTGVVIQEEQSSSTTRSKIWLSGIAWKLTAQVIARGN